MRRRRVLDPEAPPDMDEDPAGFYEWFAAHPEVDMAACLRERYPDEPFDPAVEL